MLEVLPNGTLVEKCNSTRGDSHADGARGHVLAALTLLGGYFVAWDDRPHVPVIVPANRIRRRRRQRAAA